ncbi:DsbA family protein [Paraburkholderia sp. J8-2]|uniref:DsbA family oxidoreductase n=1 Tax=Paraburkholderia sp. J8-2 TaxID=2805440 RepID=UPI002AB61A5A|nr:DsbA family protein [Paraburkholderia sp. J8-2]
MAGHEAVLPFHYHGRAEDPSDREVLVEVARSVGLDVTQTRRKLGSSEYADEVRGEVAQFQTMAINSVPLIIFDNRYLVTDGQPAEAFVQIVRDVLATRHG